MIGNQNHSCDVLASVESLESLLEETFRISEKILSRTPDDILALDEWNYEIETENLNYLNSLSGLHKKFIVDDRIINLN